MNKSVEVNPEILAQQLLSAIGIEKIVHGETQPDEKKRLEAARESLTRTIDRTARVIETIRYFRSIRQPGSFKTFAVSVSEVLREVFHAAPYESLMSGVTLFKNVPDDLPFVSLPREHLETILLQLLMHLTSRCARGRVPLRVQASVFPEAVAVEFSCPVASEPPPARLDENRPQPDSPFFTVQTLVRLNRGVLTEDYQSKPGWVVYSLRLPLAPRTACL